ncbi:hypothetical protein Aab01nite_41340 [Paractinoplanes abujensis]|uniref:Uncharacterized protein n=1 Tax=Paractinoplanes abujensis TaxID=882441 RepID=A0A7W7CT72_9ACTN|nr:hypothetical protein [Actinoplanes abujensis]MBB4694243.1 hypothetical protein [Actinoplanes abujensis]GID20544.1 hypothetical protein Aab01nite_41340 [Actinoplanes abujensis]
MHSLRALLRALRTRRRSRIDRGRADMIAATHPPGDDHPGLAALLEAARAPGTPEELAGEKEMVAAFTAHRKRAARSVRRRRTASFRAALVPVTTGLALLILAGTAVAARTGNLPVEAQQHAHRLFSALGVPAPGTGSPQPSSSTRPSPRPSLDVTALSWCEAWRGTPERSLSREDRRKLTDAAGGEDDIAKYCEKLHPSASPSPSATPSGPASPSTTGTPSAPATSSTPSETPSETEPPPTPGSDPSLSTDRD